MNFVLSHVPGAGSIARLVYQQSSVLPQYHWCPLKILKKSIKSYTRVWMEKNRNPHYIWLLEPWKLSTKPLFQWPLLSFCPILPNTWNIWCFRPRFCAVRLYWAVDYIGYYGILLWINHSSCWPAVQHAITVLWLPVNRRIITSYTPETFRNEHISFVPLAPIIILPYPLGLITFTR